MAGGPRPGSGRKPGSKSKIDKKARELAKQTGEMPHDILLSIARGELINQKVLEITYYKSGANKGQEKSRKWIDVDYYPTFNERVDAAKSCAPYFAPRLATQVIKTDEQTADALTAVMKELAGKLPG